jgi:hypothetical protein
LHAFCKDDRDEFGVLAADACPVSCSSSFILLCNSNNKSITFDTLETKTQLIAGTTAIQAGAFPDGAALKAVRHKFPSTTMRSDRTYTLQTLQETWKDSLAASEMGAPPLPATSSRNAGIELGILNNYIVGPTTLRKNAQLRQLTAKVTMAVDPCKLRVASGCTNVSGRTLEICAPGQAALFSYDAVNATWTTDGSKDAHVDPNELTNSSAVTGLYNASLYLLDSGLKALDAAGFSPLLLVLSRYRFVARVLLCAVKLYVL